MSGRAAALSALEGRLGHRFARPALLDEALTHATYVSPVQAHNQRLEFLGDRVLGLCIAEALVAADTAAPEGVLAPRLNALVRKETCAAIAADLGLGEAIQMGRSELLSGGRRKTEILGDAMEAVIAALYLDAGMDVARAVVHRLWADRITAAPEEGADAKSTLQAFAQSRGEPPPTYTEVGREGPPHAPVFTVEVRLEGGLRAVASARSKRAAEQAAASDLLAGLEDPDG